MYHEYSLSITDNQKRKITRAYQNNTGVRIRMSSESIRAVGNVKLLLTAQQISKIEKAKKSGNGVEIKFSKTQLRKQGGFLSALLNLGKVVLPFLAKKVLPTLGLAAASGAIQGATNNAVNK